jgi:curli production assembly/transport component CsgF
MSSADAQNDFQEENTNPSQKSEMEQFTESLNRQLLNQLSRDLFKQEYGDSPLTVGTYSFGSLVVDISPTAGGLNIDIFDINTGEQTQIIIPN